jgi:redox-sensitive bicupin YhaK (pirin superfamily)
MQVLRAAADRGQVKAGWLDSRHTFSFGHFHDPSWMGWGPLRVINEDRVAPGAGFPPHGHANMEILSYVLDGALAHRDDNGGEGVLRAGELQWMSAGHGIEHSEFNASKDAPVHFLQIWIQPDRVNAPPAHAQRAFDPQLRRGRWATLASPDGVDGSLAIRQQAWLHGVRLGEGESAAFTLQPGRRYWLHLAQGAAEVDGRALVAGDAIGYSGEAGELHVEGVAGDVVADVLLFDLPA